MWEASIDPKLLEFKIFSSVVPELKNMFTELFNNLSSSVTICFDSRIYPNLPLNIPNHNEIGTDIVSNCLAANQKFKTDLLIIDFGTALTFTVVDSNGQILGVNIAPGVKIALENLVSRTSQLPMVDITFPLNPLGSNTVEAIQNGVLIGYVGLVKYMIKVLKTYLDFNFLVIGTGGLSSVIHPHVGEFDYIEKNLTLDGLLFAGNFVLHS